MTKKVLFVATVDAHIELFHLPYLEMFKERGYEVHVATDSNKPIEHCDKKIRLSIKRSPFKFISNHKAICQLKKVMDSEDYEIVHCHTPMGGVVARMAGKKARRNGTRIIYTAHGFHFYNGAPLYYWLMFYPVEKYLAKFTDTIITINQEDYDRAKHKFAKRCKNIQYVPGVGVDIKKFSKKLTSEEKSELKKKLGLKQDDKILICVGRLDKNKNQGFLIRAMKKLVEKNPEYQLLLVGSDELSGKYQNLAKKLGVNKNMHFLGFRKDIPDLLQISDVVVSVSKREGLPVNLIEAAMAGVPVIALNCRGCKDVCNEINNKSIIIGENSDEFIEAVYKINSVSNNKSATLEMFAINNIIDVMSEIYFRKKRILHILASNRYSGAENVACTIISNLFNEFEMAYCSPRGPIEKALKERKVKYIGIDKLNYSNFKKVVQDFRPDIIHAHDYRASLMASMFGKKYRIISHIHLDNPKVRGLSIWSILYNIAASRYEKIIWVSGEAKKNFYYCDNKRIKEKSIVLVNIVDEKYIISKANEYNVGESFDLIFTGRLSEQKNPERAIEILRLVKAEIPNIKMAIVGDGEKRGKIEELVAKYNLGENIRIFGFVDNPYPIMKNSKILLMTSKFEGTPMVALEALALGRAIVGTKFSGLQKITSKNSDSFLSDNDSELVTKIIEILKTNKNNSLSTDVTTPLHKEDTEVYFGEIADIYNCHNDCATKKTMQGSRHAKR